MIFVSRKLTIEFMLTKKKEKKRISLDHIPLPIKLQLMNPPPPQTNTHMCHTCITVRTLHMPREVHVYALCYVLSYAVHI